VVLGAETISRRHALLTFRDGAWIVQDLDSTNGTRLNSQRVGRCRLRPGDQLALADQRLRID
jgi:pSer/pThr/pTyr-binding forkhead associated (FHA) protein